MRIREFMRILLIKFIRMTNFAFGKIRQRKIFNFSSSRAKRSDSARKQSRNCCRLCEDEVRSNPVRKKVRYQNMA